MKRNLLISFGVLIVMIIVMRWQGSTLITSASPKGIIDLEFARTPERLQQLRLFLNPADVNTNIYLDFLFIAAYVWFLFTACRYIRHKTGWDQWSNRFGSLAISAGMFDLAENFILLLILNGSFEPRLMEVVFYCALIKFILAGGVVLFLLMAWPFSLIRKKR